MPGPIVHSQYIAALYIAALLHIVAYIFYTDIMVYWFVLLLYLSILKPGPNACNCISGISFS